MTGQGVLSREATLRDQYRRVARTLHGLQNTDRQWVVMTAEILQRMIDQYKLLQVHFANFPTKRRGSSAIVTTSAHAGKYSDFS